MTLSSSRCRCQEAVVTTTFGKLMGSVNELGRVFYGVPYAKSPSQSRRFMDPQPWDEQYIGGIRNASSPGAKCVSNSQKDGEEDCLFANFFTPLNATPQSNLPVMLFIHGGSFVNGCGSDYDSSHITSANNVIVVTINYRLGSFGFLQLNDTSANFGFKDQREAIRFVKKEVAAFGGDPDRLMVFGESAGAISVQLHVVAKKSGDGLFSYALSESGFPTLKLRQFSLNSTDIYLKAVGCAKTGTGSQLLACLQSKTVQELLNASETTSPGNGNPFVVPGWGPSIDDVEFFEDPLVSLRNGNFNLNITVIAGSNTDEGWLFAPQGYVDGTAYRNFVRALLYGHGKPLNETEIAKVLKEYPLKTIGDNHGMASAVAGDCTFVCGSRYMVRMASTYSYSKPFLYHFDVPTYLGLALHASELPFVFDWKNFTTAQQAVSDGMGKLWSSFARGVNPTANIWPTYDNETDQNILFNVDMPHGNFQIESNRRKSYCDFWEESFFNAPSLSLAARQWEV